MAKQPMTPTVITAEQARIQMADLLTAAKEHGTVTVITRYGKPAAQICPIPSDEETAGV